MAALRGEPFDVYPAVSITSTANLDAMEHCKSFFPGAHTNAAQMASLASAGRDIYGFDSVAPYFSIHLEAAILGCPVDWGSRFSMPRVTAPPLRRLDDLSLPRDFLGHPLAVQLLKACGILRRRYGGEVAVVGKVIGPWTLAYHLRGVENLLLDTILEPEKTRAAIEKLSDISVRFACAQFEAGADVCVWADHVTSDLVSAQVYREIVFPVHRRVTKALEPYGPLILHVCGNVADRFDLFVQAGFACFHLDSRNDISAIEKIAGNKIRLAGCVNNPLTLSQGTTQRVRSEVERNIDCGISLVSPECAIPTIVPASNLKELVKTAHGRRRKK